MWRRTLYVLRFSLAVHCPAIPQFIPIEKCVQYCMMHDAWCMHTFSERQNHCIDSILKLKRVIATQAERRKARERFTRRNSYHSAAISHNITDYPIKGSPCISMQYWLGQALHLPTCTGTCLCSSTTPTIFTQVISYVENMSHFVARIQLPKWCRCIGQLWHEEPLAARRIL